MPRIIETTVYTIDELSGAAKENARIWYRDQGLYDEWYDFVYEDFETICRIIGITLATSPRAPLRRRNPRQAAGDIFPGSGIQGDGASLCRPVQLRQEAPPRPSAPTRRRTRSCTASRIELQAASDGSNFFQVTQPPSGSRAATATNTP